MKTTVEILKEARDLIAKPENWTQHAYARTADHIESHPDVDEACSFCSAGAVYKATGLSISQHLPPEILSALGFAKESDVYEFNDNAYHTEVLDLFSKAISSAEEKAQ